MTAPPEFGAAIPTDGKRLPWLPDDVLVSCLVAGTWDTLAWCPSIAAWHVITAIRLEVPRYDFVYLALERVMVPWFGGDEAPGDWDRTKDVLLEDGTTAGYFHWMQGDGWMPIIGYYAYTSTALPLAHPAAPQGEVDARIKRVIAAAKRVVSDYPAAAGAYPDIEGGDSKPGWGSIRSLAEALAALAPAAIASGREGAE